ncbi:MAG: GNAT family N-acetyltransferase [bacterium]
MNRSSNMLSEENYQKILPSIIPFNAKDHFDILYDWITKDEIMKAYDFRPPSKDEVLNWVGNDVIFMITIKDELAGYINLSDFHNLEKTADLGYMLIEKYRGKGYMNYAMKHIIGKAKEMGLAKIKAYTRPENTISQKVLLKYDFKYTKRAIEHNWSHYDGEIEWNWYELEL